MSYQIVQAYIQCQLLVLFWKLISLCWFLCMKAPTSAMLVGGTFQAVYIFRAGWWSLLVKDPTICLCRLVVPSRRSALFVVPSHCFSSILFCLFLNKHRQACLTPAFLTNLSKPWNWWSSFDTFIYFAWRSMYVISY